MRIISTVAGLDVNSRVMVRVEGGNWKLIK